MKHFISTTDLSPAELDELLMLAAQIKSGEETRRLKGKKMGMVFFNSSLRTRTSFEAGMYDLGGHAINLTVGQGMWNLETRDGVVMDQDAAEHVREAVPVLSRYVDILGVRCFPFGKDWEVDKTDPTISSFVAHSEVPVVSMESAIWHPCQALADALTWNEQGVRKGDTVVLTWAYHPKALPMAVANSVVAVAAQRGLNLRVLRPDPFALDRDLMAAASAIAAETGGMISESSSLDDVSGAKIVYAKSWGSLMAYGDAAAEKKIRDKYKEWMVTEDLMKKTADGKFMHCLPVRRNVIVEDAVLDSKTSIVVDQAENRLHAQKALLLKMLAR
jgi:N-acetylornithine carbamoyltransferase